AFARLTVPKRCSKQPEMARSTQRGRKRKAPFPGPFCSGEPRLDERPPAAASGGLSVLRPDPRPRSLAGVARTDSAAQPVPLTLRASLWLAPRLTWCLAEWHDYKGHVQICQVGK